jgi:hypothetical protein
MTDCKYPSNDWSWDEKAQTIYDVKLNSMKRLQPSFILLTVLWLAAGVVISGLTGYRGPAIAFGIIAILHAIFFKVAPRYWPQPVCSTCGLKMLEDWKSVKTIDGRDLLRLFHSCPNCKTYVTTNTDRLDGR